MNTERLDNQRVAQPVQLPDLECSGVSIEEFGILASLRPRSVQEPVEGVDSSVSRWKYGTLMRSSTYPASSRSPILSQSTQLYRLIWLSLILIPLVVRSSRAQDGHPVSPGSLHLIENQGQVRDIQGNTVPDVQYVARDRSLLFAIRKSGFSYVFRRPAYALELRPPVIEDRSEEVKVPPPDELYRVDVEFIGALTATVTGTSNPGGAVERYYRGSTTPIEVFPTDSVQMSGLYPGVDAIVRASSAGLKYDLRIAPTANVAQIRFRYIGADRVDRLSDGSLRITTPFGVIVEGAPVTWQENPHARVLSRELGVPVQERHPVESRFRVDGNVVSIELGEHDSKLPIVFDPSLLWSTYYGGGDIESAYEFSGFGGAIGRMVDADLDGSVVLGCHTTSLDFPTTPGVIQQQLRGFVDAALISIGPNGARKWATYLGGNNWDLVAGVALDSFRSVAITGITNSTDFPVTPTCAQPVLSGSQYDVFVALIDSTGRLKWGSYYGGSNIEQAGGCCFDRLGRVVIGGSTWSTDLIVTPGAFQPAARNGGDAFVVAFDEVGRRRWATYLGGTREDRAGWITCDPSGNVTIAGGTFSSDFPTSAEAYQTSFGGDRDGFLAQFDSAGRVRWLSMLGGTGADWVYSVDSDPRGNIAVGGQTRSDNFPTTPGVAQRTIAGATSRLDGFAAVFTPDGRLQWSTYYGGSRNDNAAGIASAPTGHVYIVGSTVSPDLLHSRRNYQDSLRGGNDFFVAEFDSLGNVVWDTYFGGSGSEIGSGIAGDCFGGVVVAGTTNSNDLPIVGGLQSRLNTTRADPTHHQDVFIARFCNSIDLKPVPDGPVVFCSGDSVVLWAPRGFRDYRWIPGGQSTPSITVRASGEFSILVLDSLGCRAVTDTLGVVVHQRPMPAIEFLGSKTICQGETTVLRGLCPGGSSWRWSTGDTTQTLSVSRPGRYTLTATDTNGCVVSVSSDSVSVLATARKPSISPSDTIWICPDSLVMLDAGPGFTPYLWSNGVPSRQVFVGVGTYWVRVYEAGVPCPAYSDTVVVALYPKSIPVISGTGSGTICSGDTITLDAGTGYRSYRWSNGSNVRTIRVTDSGWYAVTTVSAQGCTGRSDSVHIRVAQLPNPSISAIGPTSFCEGDSVILQGDSGYAAYRWSSGDSTRWITVRTSGTYSLEVTTLDGCSGTAVPAAVTVHPLPTGAIVPRGPTTFLEGDSLRLDVTGVFDSCVWSNGDTGPALVVRTSGRYGAVIADTNGCTVSLGPIDVVVVPPVPDPKAVVTLPNLLVTPGERFTIAAQFATENLEANGITGVVGELRFNRTVAMPQGLTPAGWTDGNERVLPIVARVTSDSIPTVTFEMLATLGDAVSTPIHVTNLKWEGGSVPTISNTGELRLDSVCMTGNGRLVLVDGALLLRPVRPNPVRDMAEIDFSIVEDGWTRVSLVDALGRTARIVTSAALVPGTYTSSLRVDDLPPGAYFLVLQTPANRISAPFVIAP